MIPVVSGMPRTGTSMMMKAGQAGGLEVAYDDVQDKRLGSWGDADWQLQHGESVYEPGPKMFAEWDWPLAYDGKLIKVMFGGLARLAPNPDGYRYVFMLRDPEEIFQSNEALRLKNRRAAPTWLRDGGYEKRMDLAIAGLRNRKDTVSVTVLEYRDVLADPVMAFAQLKSDGWDIDVDAAAAVPDESMCRFRLEELEVGI